MYSNILNAMFIPITYAYEFKCIAKGGKIWARWSNYANLKIVWYNTHPKKTTINSYLLL